MTAVMSACSRGLWSGGGVLVTGSGYVRYRNLL